MGLGLRNEFFMESSAEKETEMWRFRRSQQRDFLREGRLELTFNVLSSLSNVEFFVKNRESRYVVVSPGMQLSLGCFDSVEVFGTNDYDYVLPTVADQYLRDDQVVIREKIALRDRFEFFCPFASASRLVKTTKFPVYDQNGRVIGLVGVLRQCNASSKEVSEKYQRPFHSPLFDIVSAVQRNLDRRMTLDALSAVTGRSRHALSRSVMATFGVNVPNFVERIRFQCIAREILTSYDQIGNLAERFGFRNSGRFCVRFKEVTGVTPKELRKNWENGKAVGHNLE